MKRGDVVIVAATGDYGKPRAAVIVQTDAFPETHASVVICQMTSEIATFASQSIQVRKMVCGSVPRSWPTNRSPFGGHGSDNS